MTRRASRGWWEQTKLKEGICQMVRNEGTVDRALRVIVGLVLLGLAVQGMYTPWTWIGIVPLLTGLVGVCPLYGLLGIRTCKMR
jgi:hypothetical protein